MKNKTQKITIEKIKNTACPNPDCKGNMLVEEFIRGHCKDCDNTFVMKNPLCPECNSISHWKFNDDKTDGDFYCDEHGSLVAYKETKG